MRIGIHAIGLLPYRTGRECYVQALLEALSRLDHDDEYSVFVSPQNRHLFQRPEHNFRTIEVRLPRLPSRRLWELAYLRLAASVRRLDVVHLAEWPLPLYEPAKAVATVHDVVPLVHPEFFPLKGRLYYQKALALGTRHLRAMTALSENTKRDMVSRLGLDPRRIHVISPAVEPRFAPITDAGAVAAMRRKYGLPERFVLYVGTLEPRKNLVRLIAAHRRLRAKGFDEMLVLAGGKGWMCDDVVAAAKATPEAVRLTGFVDDDDLPALYNAAHLFVYPSLYEGFGTPPLEAMACGLPVVCSDTSSLPEVVGDAALLVNPEDEQELADAIWDAAHDEGLHGRLRKNGLARARLFTWDETARRTLDVYRLLTRAAPTENKETARDAA